MLPAVSIQHLSPLGSIPSPSALIAAGYAPLDYSAGTPACLTDSAIAARLDGLSLRLYQKMLPLQDKRDDSGHVNTVVHFTLELSRMLGFDRHKTESAVLSAIGHDVGWSRIENISKVFSDIVTRQQRGMLPGGDQVDAERARSEDRLLRVRHQDEAVKLVTPFLMDHPDREDIWNTIGDHDTRERPFPTFASAFLDSDWLWRVTARVVDCGTAGEWDKNDPESVVSYLSASAETLAFLNPLAQSIARLETANSLLALQQRNGWNSLPQQFLARYAEEIEALTPFQSACLPSRSQGENRWAAVQTQKLTGGTLALPFALDLPVSESYKHKIDQLFPEGKPVVFLNAWHQALRNSAMPIDFAESQSYQEFTFSLDGQRYFGIKMIGIDDTRRQEAILSSSQHTPLLPLENYELRLTSECVLDTSITHALDAQRNPSQIKSNALADLGEFIWMVNKFPWWVTDTLILPKNHDLLDNRAQLDEKTRLWQKSTPTDTRGAVLTYPYLATVFAICDRYNHTAQRNHALDGMSVPLHDHFKLCAAGHPLMSLLPLFIKPQDLERSEVRAYRAVNTPFDTLCLTSLDHNQLAHSAALLLENLERADQVFTLIYTPGTLLITPRRAELYGAGNPDGLIGSTVGAHGIKDPSSGSPQFSRILKYVPRSGEFDWQRFLTASWIDSDL